MAAGAKVGGEFGFQMLKAWDPSLEFHKKFRVPVLAVDSGFASLV